MIMMWDRFEQKTFDSVPAYHPHLQFPSRANISPLEREHLDFIKKVNGIPINTPFIESLSNVPDYTKFIQDLMDNRQQLKRNSKVILSEQSSKVVLGELPKNMGDPGRLTLPCEYGNNLQTYALADSGAGINLMPFSFYKKLNTPKLKATRMTIHMANHSVTQPRGITECILVKIGNFVFPIDFVVMHMKEDANVPIILGRPLLNIVGAVVDIRESKLTLRVGDEEETFGVQDGFQGSDVQGEVFKIDEEDKLGELQKLVEEELKTIQQVKRTKPKVFTPFLVEVFAYTKPTSWVSKESDGSSSDEDEVTSKEMSPVVREEKIPMELKNNEEKLENTGTKCKIDVDEKKAKKENSKKGVH
ncbi:uncharacterized protein LOC111897104 [Lactuca sativa]|uniref:uncharacterized protein LOC111897104 n=1 Tax=Lactuca sativa TaxID=4236 RepID=UPI000CD8FB04|nr:uncharacterized protein LOC111897104 [Lactuca sativa]